MKLILSIATLASMTITAGLKHATDFSARVTMALTDRVAGLPGVPSSPARPEHDWRLDADELEDEAAQ